MSHRHPQRHPTLDSCQFDLWHHNRHSDAQEACQSSFICAAGDLFLISVDPT